MSLVVVPPDIKINVVAAPIRLILIHQLAGLVRSCSWTLQKEDSWDVAKAEKMDLMFKQCPVFNQSLASWQVNGVKSFGGMFEGCAMFAQDLSAWNVKETAAVTGMFARCEAFRCDLSSWKINSDPFKRTYLFGWPCAALGFT